MTHEDELRAIWAKIQEKDKEVREELATCKQQGRRTQRYETLLKDSARLKEEYEKVKGGKPYDPHNLGDVESAAARTLRQFKGG